MHFMSRLCNNYVQYKKATVCCFDIVRMCLMCIVRMHFCAVCAMFPVHELCSGRIDIIGVGWQRKKFYIRFFVDKCALGTR